MRFVGLTTAERKLVIEALELLSRDRVTKLGRCVLPRDTLAYGAAESDVGTIGRLYDAARTGDAACGHGGCVGRHLEVVCDVCRSM